MNKSKGILIAKIVMSSLMSFYFLYVILANIISAIVLSRHVEWFSYAVSIPIFILWLGFGVFILVDASIELKKICKIRSADVLDIPLEEIEELPLEEVLEEINLESLD